MLMQVTPCYGHFTRFLLLSSLSVVNWGLNFILLHIIYSIVYSFDIVDAVDGKSKYEVFYRKVLLET